MLRRRSTADAAVQVLDAAAIGLDNVANAADLVEFVLQLVDLAQNLVEAGYLGVGVGDDVAGAVILELGGGGGLVGELDSQVSFGHDCGVGKLTAAQRDWMLCSRRSKCWLNACRLDGSSSRRPWDEAWLAAREEEPPCCERASC